MHGIDVRIALLIGDAALLAAVRARLRDARVRQVEASDADVVVADDLLRDDVPAETRVIILARADPGECAAARDALIGGTIDAIGRIDDLDALPHLIAAVVAGVTAVARSVIECRASLLPFSKRQDAVLDLVLVGATNKAIARQLDVSVATVKREIRELMNRLAARTRIELAARALATGIRDAGSAPLNRT